MDISIKHYGSSNGDPSKIIEMTAKYYGNIVTADITNIKGEVDVNLIMALRDIADELEEQNRLLSKGK